MYKTYKINNAGDLRNAIVIMESEMDEQKRSLNAEINLLYQSFKPVNIVKDVINEVMTSEDLRANLLTATIGISTGYLTKKLIFKKSNSTLKSLTGNLIQYGLANLIIHPSRTLKTLFLPLMGLLLNRNGERPGEGSKGVQDPY